MRRYTRGRVAGPPVCCVARLEDRRFTAHAARAAAGAHQDVQQLVHGGRDVKLEVVGVDKAELDVPKDRPVGRLLDLEHTGTRGERAVLSWRGLDLDHYIGIKPCNTRTLSLPCLSALTHRSYGADMLSGRSRASRVSPSADSPRDSGAGIGSPSRSSTPSKDSSPLGDLTCSHALPPVSIVAVRWHAAAVREEDTTRGFHLPCLGRCDAKTICPTPR